MCRGCVPAGHSHWDFEPLNRETLDGKFDGTCVGFSRVMGPFRAISAWYLEVSR